MKKALPVPIIIGAVALAVIVLAVFALRSLSDPPTPVIDRAKFMGGPPKTIPPTAP